VHTDRKENFTRFPKRRDERRSLSSVQQQLKKRNNIERERATFVVVERRRRRKESLTNTTDIRNGNELLEIHTLFHIFISVSICTLIRSPIFKNVHVCEMRMKKNEIKSLDNRTNTVV
jgi:hypothetical protein